MLRNYITVAIRALTKHRAYAIINILGLAIGMAACLLILLYVRYEMSYDRFWPDAARSYQLQATITDKDSGVVQRPQQTPFPAGAALRKDFPEIEAASYVANSQPVFMKQGEAVVNTVTLVEPDFFRIFQLHFLRGGAADAMRDINSLAISRRTAIAWFGTEDAIGRTLNTVIRGQQVALRVAAVFEDLPKNSHQNFNMLRRLNVARDIEPAQLTAWGWLSGDNYVKLRPGADAAAINARLPAWQDRNVPRSDVGGHMVRQDQGFAYTLTALPDIHLGLAQEGSERPGNDPAAIATFAVIALLILAMACVNFTNLATARASQRAREVALRKVLGASRKQLIAQFLVESVVVAAVAMLVALALSELALPFLAKFLDADLRLTYLGRGGVLPPVLLLVALVGVAGGAYPAFLLSGFRPARVLKANRSAEASGSGRLRGVLVVGQFAISIALIVCTAVVYAQTVYGRSVDPGFQRRGLLQIENISRRPIIPLRRTLQQEIARVPGVRGTALTSIGVNTDNRSNNPVMLPGREQPMNIGGYGVSPGFFETMGIKPIAGRTLSDAVALDDMTITDPLQTEPDPVKDRAAQLAMASRGGNVVINALAARRMGFASPADAVGKQIRIGLLDDNLPLVPLTIVGVVNDTRYRSVREPNEAIVYRYDRGWMSYMEVRFDSADPAGVKAGIERVWKRLAPQVPFDADFADARAAALYRAEAARAQTFAGFAILSVIVGCLGLFGLASFTAERRTKEIGIRKVLGARTRDIVRLLVWQFSRPVLLANLIAWPVAWWAMRNWLNGFDTRIALTPLPFVAAGALAMVIAIVTIGGHALRVARANPIVALRYE